MAAIHGPKVPINGHKVAVPGSPENPVPIDPHRPTIPCGQTQGMGECCSASRLCGQCEYILAMERKTGAGSGLASKDHYEQECKAAGLLDTKDIESLWDGSRPTNRDDI